MWFLVILLLTNVSNIGCLDNYDAEKQRYDELNLQYDEKVTQLTSGNSDTERIKEYLKNDSLWKQIKQSEVCLGLNSKTTDEQIFGDQEISKIVIGIIAGPIIGIVGTEWAKRWITRKNAIKAIHKEMISITEMLINDKLPFDHPLVPESVEYLNQRITTTAFETVISSGAMMYLSPKLQERLDALYFQIKHHNKTLERLDEFYAKWRTEKLSLEGDTVMIELIEQLSLTDNLVALRIKKIGDMEKKLRIDEKSLSHLVSRNN